LIALRLNQVLAHEIGGAPGLAVANRLIDVPMGVGDGPEITAAIGRLPALLVARCLRRAVIRLLGFETLQPGHGAVNGLSMN